MPHFVTVATRAEIPPGTREIFEIDGLYIVVFNVDGTYYAIEDVCTHDDGPLAEGDLDGFSIACPRHGACFDIRTGQVQSMPAVVDVLSFPVRVDGDDVQIDLDPTS